MQLHWDGDNDSVDERNLSAGLGAGITPVTVDHAGIKRVRDWIWTLPPPPIRIRWTRRWPRAARRSTSSSASNAMATIGSATASPPARARQGRRIERHQDGPLIGSIPTRRRSRANQYGLFPDSPYRFPRFRKTHGYANQPLDGIWLRGPYLHNGSVPTLRDLLEPAGRAPGYVLSRLRRVRRRSAWGSSRTCAESSGRRFFRYDTTDARQQQHAATSTGTTLSDADKAAIVEYLKTF